MGGARVTRLLERIAVVVAAFVVAIAVIALLSGGLLAGNDDPGVSAGGGPLGIAYRDLGHAHLAQGTLRPVYNSNPPTSGPHVPLPVTRDASELTDDQLLQALEVGDVVIMYGSRLPPPGARQLADSIAAPFTPAVAAAGQAVILARRPGTSGLIGLAWTHLLPARSATDPALHSFLAYWLGRGAPGP